VTGDDAEPEGEDDAEPDGDEASCEGERLWLGDEDGDEDGEEDGVDDPVAECEPLALEVPGARFNV
jgi:hypothetical protein